MLAAGALATVSAGAWAYLSFGAGIEREMMDIGGRQMMTVLPEWSLSHAVLIFVMLGR